MNLGKSDNVVDWPLQDADDACIENMTKEFLHDLKEAINNRRMIKSDVKKLRDGIKG